MSALDDLPPLRDVIRRHGLSAQKSLGQNFLLDLNLTGRIARASGPLEGVTVVEVGPGPGGLTRALLALGAGRVIAIERDRRCLDALTEIADHYPGRLEVISGDALEAAINPAFCKELDRQRARKRGVEFDRATPGMFDECIGLASTTVLLGSSNRKTFDRVGFLIPPYEAGPYAEGSYEVTLPVSEAILRAVKPEFRGSFSVSR